MSLVYDSPGSYGPAPSSTPTTFSFTLKGYPDNLTKIRDGDYTVTGGTVINKTAFNYIQQTYAPQNSTIQITLTLPYRASYFLSINVNGGNSVSIYALVSEPPLNISGPTISYNSVTKKGTLTYALSKQPAYADDSYVLSNIASVSYTYGGQAFTPSYTFTGGNLVISNLDPYVPYNFNIKAYGFAQVTSSTAYVRTVTNDMPVITASSTDVEKATAVITARNIIKTIADSATKTAQQATYISTMRTALGGSGTLTYSVTDLTQKSSLVNTLNAGANASLVKSEIVGVLPAFSGTSATINVATYDITKSYLFEVPIGYTITLQNGASSLALTYNGTQFTGTGGPYGVNSNVNVGGKVFKLWGFGSAGVNPLSSDVTVTSVVVDGQTATFKSGSTTEYNQIRTTAFTDNPTITITTNHPNATVVVTKPTKFVAEDNVVTFEVTAEDTITKQTYTLPIWVKPDYLPCFPAGTKIMVPGGYKAVEDLKASDLVVTSDGRQVSFKRYKTHIPKANKETAPYLVKAGAFGRAQPPNDVRLSGLHAIQSRKGVWQIPQYAALSNENITQYGLGESVTYYHIELPNFFTDNLVVEGAVCESYAANQADHIKTVYNYNGNLNGFTRVSGKPASKPVSK